MKTFVLILTILGGYKQGHSIEHIDGLSETQCTAIGEQWLSRTKEGIDRRKNNSDAFYICRMK